MKLIRFLLGRIILFFDFITTPRSVKRDAKVQAILDEKTAKLSLYQFHACPFCVKVRRAIKRNNLNIELRDAKQPGVFREELAEYGGKIKVPCLRIENGNEITWMYESTDIIHYLENNIAA